MKELIDFCFAHKATFGIRLMDSKKFVVMIEAYMWHYNEEPSRRRFVSFKSKDNDLNVAIINAIVAFERYHESVAGIQSSLRLS